jgi:hypothetical protein
VKVLEEWRGREKWFPKAGDSKPELNEAVK